MTNTFLLSVLLCWILLFFTSCTTYTIPVDSFKLQFAAKDSVGQKEVTAQGPLGGTARYKTVSPEVIRAVDKNGNPVAIPISPSIEVRIWDTANHKTILYADQLQFDGENITGSGSRLARSIKKIPIGSVTKIEVQNGRKNFRYTDKKR